MTEFNFITAQVGRVPHEHLNGLIGRLHHLLDIPAWPQLPHRSFRENMYAQYSPRGGSICWGIVPNNEQIFSETAQGLADRQSS